MDKVIIVECISTSMNYVHDIRQRGLEPVILETYNDDGGKEEARRQANYVHMEKPLPRRIQAKPDYNDTLELVRAENPILLLPGAEMSVELATKLAHDLGLKSNDPKNLPQMTRKSEMHKALKDAGLRYIRGEMVANVEEALSFWEGIDKKPVVIKPTHSAGAVSVHICDNEDQIAAGVKDIIGTEDMFGELNDKALIQEKIGGTEYIANTVSCEGENYVTSVYKYKKRPIPGGSMLYDINENIMDSEITAQEKELMEYAQKAVKAIGIEYGPVHGEYMLDDEGPVLMEVNCRICGGDMTREFLDTMFGHHETDRSLECYFDPDKFKEHMNAGYKTTGKGFFKLLRVLEDIDIVDAPICKIAEKLPSFISYVGIEPDKKLHMKKTVDLYTNGGKFSFASHDAAQAKRDCDEIDRIEKQDYDSM